MAGTRRVFYGWVIVAAGMLVMATAVGIVNNCFGLFIVPACEELGYARAEMGMVQTLLSLGSMLVTLFMGKLIGIFGLRRLMRLGAVAMCACYALFYVARSLWAFYAVALAVAFAQSTINVVPFSLIVGNWFHEKRGLAIGLTFMGSGVGGAVFNLLGGQLVSGLGWRFTVLAFAGIMAAIILPLVFFVIRIEPAEMNLAPLGAGGREEAADAAQGGLSLRQAMRTPRFYVIVADIVIAGLAVNAIATTATPFFTDIYASETAGAAMASAFMVSLAFGKFALGGIYDRFGTRKSTLLTRALTVIAVVSLSLCEKKIFIAPYLLACGLACASSTVSIPMLARGAFGLRDAATITGVFSAAQSLGGTLAPSGCGWVCDLTGSYAPAYRILGLGVLAMIPAIAFALSQKSPRALRTQSAKTK